MLQVRYIYNLYSVIIFFTQYDTSKYGYMYLYRRIHLANAELPNAELLNVELLNAELPNVELSNVELPNAENYPT